LLDACPHATRRPVHPVRPAGRGGGHRPAHDLQPPGRRLVHTPGENLEFPPGQTFPLYPLAALLPLLPAKQRPTHPNDWMTTDAEVACPDPNCPTRFRITRLGLRRFSHAQVTATKLPAGAA